MLASAATEAEPDLELACQHAVFFKTSDHLLVIGPPSPSMELYECGKDQINHIKTYNFAPGGAYYQRVVTNGKLVASDVGWGEPLLLLDLESEQVLPTKINTPRCYTVVEMDAERLYIYSNSVKKREHDALCVYAIASLLRGEVEPEYYLPRYPETDVEEMRRTGLLGPNEEDPELFDDRPVLVVDWANGSISTSREGCPHIITHWFGSPSAAPNNS